MKKQYVTYTPNEVNSDNAQNVLIEMLAVEPADLLYVVGILCDKAHMANTLDVADGMDLGLGKGDLPAVESEEFLIGKLMENYLLNLGILDEAKEAFAEMSAATITTPESLAAIKEYLPNAYDAYLAMIEEVTR